MLSIPDSGHMGYLKTRYTTQRMKQLFTAVSGQGSPIVLIHGMAASSHYWDELVPLLSPTHHIVTLDLLGFGRSPKPHIQYTYHAHISAIKQALEQLRIVTPVILVGHSMGALIALRMAREHPELVKKVVMIGCPIYANPLDARREITQGKLLPRLAYYGPTSQVLCTLWCGLLRPLSKRLAPLYLSYLTPGVAQDSVLHTWHSYNSSMQHIIEQQSVGTDFRRCLVPIEFIYGNEDTAAHPDRITPPPPKQVTFTELAGNHQLVWQHPKKIAKLILE